MWNLIYAGLFILSFILAFLLTPVCRSLALKFNIVDHPGDRKIHLSPKPYLGGLSIFVSMSFLLIVGVLLALLVLPNIATLPDEIKRYLANVDKVLVKIIALLIGGTFIFLLGLVDDIKRLSPIQKLIGQFVAALILVSMGIRLDLFLNNHLFI